MASWKKNKIIGVIAGVGILVAIVFIVKSSTSAPKNPILLKCESTGELFVKRVPGDTTYPIACPSGSKEAYPTEVIKYPSGKEKSIIMEKVKKSDTIPINATFITDKKLTEMLKQKRK